MKYNIAYKYLPAIIYSDYSDLTTEETSQLNNWLLDKSLSFCDVEHISHKFELGICEVCKQERSVRQVRFKQ